MRAIAINDFGSAPALVDLPVPEPGPGEVRVRVRASSVNGFDVAVAGGYLKGMMEHRFPVVLGKDFAGTIDALGEGATRFAVGDAVYGVVMKPFVGDGSFGDYVVVGEQFGITHVPRRPRPGDCRHPRPRRRRRPRSLRRPRTRVR
jgi:NADPH:quinone reductase-like Zn-dependent oxidoreductase